MLSLLSLTPRMRNVGLREVAEIQPGKSTWTTYSQLDSNNSMLRKNWEKVLMETGFQLHLRSWSENEKELIASVEERSRQNS